MPEMERSRTLANFNMSTNHAYTLKRTFSMPEMTSGKDLHYVSHQYRPSPYKRYHRDWDLIDDDWWDRRHYTSPLYWPNHVWPNRRYNLTDPSYGFWWYYPALSGYPRTSRYAFLDSVDPLYYRRYRDPYYDKPLWQPHRAWSLSAAIEPKRAVQMYKQKLCNFATVERNYLQPYSWERRMGEYKEPYGQQTWITSAPRRYFYSYD